MLRGSTARDVAWCGFVAALLAASPVTGAKRLIPSLVLGSFGGFVLLVVRLRRREREGPGPPGVAIAATPLTWAVPIAALVLFAPTLGWLYGQYTDSIWRNPHGLFVPFFAFLTGRHLLRTDPDPRPDGSFWGLLLLVPACTLVVLDAGARSHYVSLVGLLLALVGLVLLLLGPRRARLLAFPLLFCLFLVPLPHGLSDPLWLPTFTAEIGRTLVEHLGLPATRYGSSIEVAGGFAIEVSQNCSGLSFFYAGCGLAILCLRTTRSWPRRMALVAAPYVLTAIGNGIRLAFLLMVGSSPVGFEWKYTTPIHGMIGTAVFLGVTGGVWLLSDRRRLWESLS